MQEVWLQSVSTTRTQVNTYKGLGFRNFLTNCSACICSARLTCLVGIRGHTLERYLTANKASRYHHCLHDNAIHLQACAGKLMPCELCQGSFRGDRRLRARLLVRLPCPSTDTASTLQCASKWIALSPVLPYQLQSQA